MFSRERGSDPEGFFSSFDPRRLLGQVESLLSVARRAGVGRLELYHRAALRMRVRLEEIARPAVAEWGMDEGLAVRLVKDRSGSVGFAAGSGGDEEALRPLLDRARRSIAPEGTVGAWAEAPVGTFEDHDPPEKLPRLELLEGWLRQATSECGDSCPAWVESALTVESLVTAEGLRASRTRTRAWAMSRVPVGTVERPRAVAARSVEDLPDPEWVDHRPESGRGPIEFGWIPRELPLALEPAAGSVLIHALVRTLCSPDRARETPVGPAFRVIEDPRHARALVGGSFDDAGFPTRPRVLADGSRTRSASEGPGYFRRPSFRDPPRPSFSTLVVEEGRETLPSDFVGVRDLRIHGLGSDRWILEIEGALHEDGSPVGRLATSFLPVRPADLPLMFGAAVGEPGLSPSSILTPTLLLDR